MILAARWYYAFKTNRAPQDRPQQDPGHVKLHARPRVNPGMPEAACWPLASSPGCGRPSHHASLNPASTAGRTAAKYWAGVGRERDQEYVPGYIHLSSHKGLIQELPGHPLADPGGFGGTKGPLSWAPKSLRRLPIGI